MEGKEILVVSNSALAVFEQATLVIRECRQCGKLLPTHAAPNRMYCAECGRARTLEIQRRSRLNHLDERRKAEMDRYFWLKSHGVCTYCAQENAQPGRTTCAACAEKNRAYAEKKKKAARRNTTKKPPRIGSPKRHK